LDKAALNIYKTLPAAGPGGRTSYANVSNQDENLGTVKVDYQINDKHSIFGRYLIAQLAQSSTFDGKNPLSISAFGFNDLDYGVALGDTYLISSNLISTLRIGANRTNIPKVNDNYGSFADFGANVSPLGGKVIALTVNGGFLIGG